MGAWSSPSPTVLGLIVTRAGLQQWNTGKKGCNMLVDEAAARLSEGDDDRLALALHTGVLLLDASGRM